MSMNFSTYEDGEINFITIPVSFKNIEYQLHIVFDCHVGLYVALSLLDEYKIFYTFGYMKTFDIEHFNIREIYNEVELYNNEENEENKKLLESKITKMFIHICNTSTNEEFVDFFSEKLIKWRESFTILSKE